MYTLSIPLEDAAQLVDTLAGPFVCFMIGIASTLLYYNLREKNEEIKMEALKADGLLEPVCSAD